jgi:predicted nucleic-acid-binding protein
MVTFDTNVVLRIVVRDDPLQCARAEGVWRPALAGEGVFLTTTVLVEIAWVLRTAFKFDRATIASKLQHLIDSRGVTVENDPVVRYAVERYKRGPADFSDWLILASARSANALPVLTFDRRFACDEGVDLVPPAENTAP